MNRKMNREKNFEMREIKFRAKHGKEWVYGDLHLMSNKPHIHSDPFTRHAINVETIGQYTGLKDKNGKEVYEGDIIRSFDSNEEAILHCIVWEEARFVALYKGRNFRSKCFLNQDWLDEFDKEVIGNICDNPKLMEM